MTIRPATLADIDRLTNLSASTMREAFGPPYNPADLVEEYVQSNLTVPMLISELADPYSTFFLVESPDGTAMGYAKLRQQAPPRQMPKLIRQAGKSIELQRIYLSQTYVGQGQGRQLMNHCLTWARTQGYAVVWLGVWERNTRALAFYEKIGFTRFGFHYFQFGSERQRDFWLYKQLID